MPKWGIAGGCGRLLHANDRVAEFAASVIGSARAGGRHGGGSVGGGAHLAAEGEQKENNDCPVSGYDPSAIEWSLPPALQHVRDTCGGSVNVLRIWARSAANPASCAFSPS